jgi:hypothetical protein
MRKPAVAGFLISSPLPETVPDGSIGFLPRLPFLLSRFGLHLHTMISPKPFTAKEKPAMPRYVVERDIPGAGKLSQQELQGISRKSCGVLAEMGSQIQWVQSYVTDNKVYCVYIAPNEEAIRNHALEGGFPADSISEVRSVIDPTTAEE